MDYYKTEEAKKSAIKRLLDNLQSVKNSLSALRLNKHQRCRLRKMKENIQRQLKLLQEK